MSEVNSENSGASVHGSVLCWTARIASTILSLIAVSYVLFAKTEFWSAWVTTAAAISVLMLSIAPSLVAWWSHRLGGAFVLILCVAYTAGASRVADEAAFLHVAIPFSAVWIASGILHLIVWWKEARNRQIPR